MGGETRTESPLQDTDGDAGQAPEKVASGVEECGKGRDGDGVGYGKGKQQGGGRPMESTESTDSTESKESTESTESTDSTEASKWWRVFDLFQTAFREGKLAEEATCQAVVLIPKGVNYYHGIGLVELMWKVVAAIFNRRLTASITFHDFLHVFRAGNSTDTATLEANLLQQIAALR